MNQVSLIGHLTRDPELREIPGGKRVCQAEACATHLAKGRQVAVSGRLVFREWTGRDGSKRSAHSVRGSVDFLGSKGDNGSPVDREPAEELALAI